MGSNSIWARSAEALYGLGEAAAGLVGELLGDLGASENPKGPEGFLPSARGGLVSGDHAGEHLVSEV
jgi:hypothetical protein